MSNEWVATALNIVTDSCMYRESPNGVQVNSGDVYILTTEQAVEKLIERVKILENCLPGVKDYLQAWARIKLVEAEKQLIKVGGVK